MSQLEQSVIVCLQYPDIEQLLPMAKDLLEQPCWQGFTGAYIKLFVHCCPQTLRTLWQPDWTQGTTILQQFGVCCGTGTGTGMGTGTCMGTGIGTGTGTCIVLGVGVCTSDSSITLSVSVVRSTVVPTLSDGTMWTLTVLMLDMLMGTSILFSLLTVLFKLSNVVTLLLIFSLLSFLELLLSLLVPPLSFVVIILVSTSLEVLVGVVQQFPSNRPLFPQQFMEHWFEHSPTSWLHLDWQLVKHDEACLQEVWKQVEQPLVW